MVKAALEIYQREGEGAVTYRRLAQVLDISHTLPYRYFPNKDALFARVQLECLRQFHREVASPRGPYMAPDEALRTMTRAYTRFVLRRPVVYRLIFASRHPDLLGQPELLAVRAQIFDSAVALVQRCVQAGLVRGDARTLTHVLWGGMHGTFMLHTAKQLLHGRELRQIIEALVDALLVTSRASRTRQSKPQTGRLANTARAERLAG